MFKKFFILLMLTLTLGPGSTYAQAPGNTEQPAPPTPQVNPTAPPPGSVDSEVFTFDLNAITHDSIEGSTRQGWIRQGVNYFFERIIGFLATVISSLSVLMLTIGGFLMLSSAGNETQYEKGKNYAKYALIGLAFALGAYVLVTLVQLLITSIYG